MKTNILVGFLVGLAVGACAAQVNWEGTHRIVSSTEGRNSFNPQKSRTLWAVEEKDGKVTGIVSPFGENVRANDSIPGEEVSGTMQRQIIEWTSTRSGERSDKRQFTCATVFHGLEDEGTIVGYFKQTWTEEGVKPVTYAGVVDLKRAEGELQIRLPSRGRIGGIVSDPDGQPMAGVSVWRHPGRPESDIKTDAHGRYEFVHNGDIHVVVVVDAVHDMAIAKDLEEGVTNLDLRLVPALTITGSVKDPQGGPIPGAEARLYLMSGTSGLVYRQPVKTDAQGGFKIVHLPADRAYDLNFGAKGYGSARQKVEEVEGSPIALPPVILKKANLKLIGRVVDASESPLAGAELRVSGNGQPGIDARTDAQGRFAMEVCEGTVNLSVLSRGLGTILRAQAGDTNLTIVLKPDSERSENEKPKRASLVGKSLGALESAGLPSDAAAPGKPILLCLFDCEQRPSRRVVRLLAEQNESLRRRGVTVLGFQASVGRGESFDRWRGANPLPFPIGRITEKTPALAWATETDSLPWLILVNPQGRVGTEGFSLEELNDKISSLSK